MGNRFQNSLLPDLTTEGTMVRVMGVHDVFSALLAEEVGFDALWASGLGISASHGVPDASVLTMTEFLDATRKIVDVVDLPIIADCDAGFGDINTLLRMVQLYEASGIAAVCIEDKVHPKRNSFRRGQQLIPKEDFAARIALAVQARRDRRFTIIARVESLVSGAGLENALTRAHLYRESGADGILIHSKEESAEEIVAFARRWRDMGASHVPLIAIPTTYFRVSESELQAEGIGVVIYANQALRAAGQAMVQVMSHISLTESASCVQKDLMPLEDLFQVTGTPDHETRETTFADLVGRSISTDMSRASNGR